MTWCVHTCEHPTYVCTNRNGWHMSRQCVFRRCMHHNVPYVSLLINRLASLGGAVVYTYIYVFGEKTNYIHGHAHLPRELCIVYS
uniref:Uncharacterized protein n=1 Tax=Pyxicephalus adspersus TaxID=30357 RepID=A0AAV3A7S8_PYXAD|nr:TPA: hypothetical protein GDO54_017228 [Pyxicephalus adspersus]